MSETSAYTIFAVVALLGPWVVIGYQLHIDHEYRMAALEMGCPVGDR